MHPTRDDLKPRTSQASEADKAWQQTALIVGGIFFAFVAFLFVQFSGNSEADDPRARDSLARLSASEPGKKFELVKRGSAGFGRELGKLKVDRVELSGSDPVQVTVHYSSIRNEAVTPKVNVHLYDRDGALLASGPVVDHIFDDLDPKESSSTSDELALKRRAAVAIIGIDDHDPLAEARAKREREQAAQRAIDAEEEKVRGPKPQASEWDGITPEANAYLKRNLKDYKSMELVECSVVVPFGEDKWAQRVRYRSKNSFGAFVVEEFVFVIRDGAVLVAVPNPE